MKKKWIFGAVVILIVTAIVLIRVKNHPEAVLLMRNVEALGRTEWPDPPSGCRLANGYCEQGSFVWDGMHSL